MTTAKSCASIQKTEHVRREVGRQRAVPKIVQVSGHDDLGPSLGPAAATIRIVGGVQRVGQGRPPIRTRSTTVERYSKRGRGSTP